VERLKVLEAIATRCAQHPGHYFIASAGTCPWCAIESASGTLLFLAPSGAIPAGSQFNLAVVWARITQIKPPGAVPEIPVPAVTPSPEASALHTSRRTRKMGGRTAVAVAAFIAWSAAPNAIFVWGLVAIGLWIWIGSWAEAGKKLSAFRQKHQQSESLLRQLQQRLQTEAGSDLFSQRLKQLEVMRAELMNLPATRDRRMKALVAEREKHARRRFLERFEIENAKIPGIGPAKRSMLESYNIETAADITESAVLNVPGFGPALFGRLDNWRRSVETRFKFDVNSGVDPRDIQDLDQGVTQQRMQLERNLLAGAQDLERLHQEIKHKREQLLRIATSAAATYAQANADWQAITG
jgi:DNA-binding helix-hairpin-helix protein with protein kinase domain